MVSWWLSRAIAIKSPDGTGVTIAPRRWMVKEMRRNLRGRDRWYVVRVCRNIGSVKILKSAERLVIDGAIDDAICAGVTVAQPAEKVTRVIRRKKADLLAQESGAERDAKPVAVCAQVDHMSGVREFRCEPEDVLNEPSGGNRASASICKRRIDIAMPNKRQINHACLARYSR